MQYESLSMDNILLKGSTLRNTKYIIGIIIYTGHETKVMLNSKIPRIKKSKVYIYIKLKFYIDSQLINKNLYKNKF